MMVERSYVDDAVDESSADQDIHKSDTTIYTMLVGNLEACT